MQPPMLLRDLSGFKSTTQLLSALVVVVFAWIMVALMGQQLFGALFLSGNSSFRLEGNQVEFWAEFSGAISCIAFRTSPLKPFSAPTLLFVFSPLMPICVRQHFPISQLSQTR